MVHRDLHAWVAVDAAERDSVHRVTVRAAQRRAARAAEREPPTRPRLVAHERLMAVRPREGPLLDLRVRRAGTAERLAAARAVAAARRTERCPDLVAHSSTETSARQDHPPQPTARMFASVALRRSVVRARLGPGVELQGRHPGVRLGQTYEVVRRVRRLPHRLGRRPDAARAAVRSSIEWGRYRRRTWRVAWKMCVGAVNIGGRSRSE